MSKKTKQTPAEAPAVWGCPKCGAHGPDDIKQYGNIAASWGGAFGADGKWEDDNNGADVTWDACDYDQLSALALPSAQATSCTSAQPAAACRNGATLPQPRPARCSLP